MAFTSRTAPVLFLIDRLRAQIAAIASQITNTALFVGAVLVIGMASSWYMVEVGTSLTTTRQGPWTSWPNAGHRSLDPYTWAHVARRGSLPISGEIAQSFEAKVDDDGQRLHSSCEYVIAAPAISAVWWSVAVYNDRGLLIPNSADRYSFTNQTTALKADGSFSLILARDARPGNWLPVGGAGRLRLVLTVMVPRTARLGEVGIVEEGLNLPAIQRVKCR